MTVSANTLYVHVFYMVSQSSFKFQSAVPSFTNKYYGYLATAMQTLPVRMGIIQFNYVVITCMHATVYGVQFDTNVRMYIHTFYRVDMHLNIRVADFGLTRDIYSTEYYRVDKHIKLPLKWMAIESILDGYFNEKTDMVCSYTSKLKRNC